MHCVLRCTGSNRVGTVAADEPTVLECNHRSELSSHLAVRAANHQSRISCRASRSHTQVFSTLVSEAKQGEIQDKKETPPADMVALRRKVGRHAD